MLGPARQMVPFLGPTAAKSAMEVSVQETFNLVTVVNAPGAKSQLTLESAPGVVDLGPGGSGGCRTPEWVSWRHPTDNTTDLYGVMGDELVRVASGGLGVSVIGTLDTATGTCRIARGRTHLLVVDGSFGYTYDGTTFAKVADTDFPDIDHADGEKRPTHVVYIDRYFLVNDALTDDFFLSALEDPTDWNPLDFERASSAPDNALAMAVTEQTLWIFGDQTSQAYYNSGSADFPFTSNLSATQQVGILAPQTVARDADGIFFVGTKGAGGGAFVYRIQGFQGQVISTDEISEELASADLSQAYGFIYTQGRRTFYALQYDPSKPTLMFNASAGAWESRGMLDNSAWRVGGLGVIDGRNVGGSRLGGRIVELRRDVYTDSGQPMVRRRRTAMHHRNGNWLDWWEVLIDGQFGGASSATDDPVVRLRYTDDGYEWSDYMEEPAGTQGERLFKAYFYGLGQSQNRAYEVSWDYDGPVTLTGAYARLTPTED